VYGGREELSDSKSQIQTKLVTTERMSWLENTNNAIRHQQETVDALIFWFTYRIKNQKRANARGVVKYEMDK